MVVLRLLLPSGLVFYVVNVLRYARLTGKGKADFLAASTPRHAHRLSPPPRPIVCGLRRLQFQLGYSRQKKYTYSMYVCAQYSHM